MEEYNYFWFYLLLLAFLIQTSWVLFSRWRTPSPRRGIALKAALLALSLLMGFVVVEGVFYFFVDLTDGAMALLTSKRWAMRHLPPKGEERHPPQQEPLPAGTEEDAICVIGDSLTYGQGVERAADLYPSILERKLRAAGIPARVFNYSSLGWDTTQETQELVYHLRSGRRCRVVVLGYCLNDLEAHLAIPPGGDPSWKRLMTAPPVLRPLADRSFFVSWLYNRWVLATSPVMKRYEDGIFAAYNNPATFTAHTKDLEHFKELCDASDVRLLVATFPHLVSPWGNYRYREIHRWLGAFWASLSVPHVDLLGEFEKHDYRDLQASILDGHPNELAHRIAAEQIYAELARRMGLPEDPEEGAPPAGGGAE